MIAVGSLFSKFSVSDKIEKFTLPKVSYDTAHAVSNVEMFNRFAAYLSEISRRTVKHFHIWNSVGSIIWNFREGEFFNFVGYRKFWKQRAHRNHISETNYFQTENIYYFSETEDFSSAYPDMIYKSSVWACIFKNSVSSVKSEAAMVFWVVAVSKPEIILFFIFITSSYIIFLRFYILDNWNVEKVHFLRKIKYY